MKLRTAWKILTSKRPYTDNQVFKAYQTLENRSRRYYLSLVRNTTGITRKYYTHTACSPFLATDILAHSKAYYIWQRTTR